MSECPALPNCFRQSPRRFLRAEEENDRPMGPFDTAVFLKRKDHLAEQNGLWHRTEGAEEAPGSGTIVA